MDPQIQLCLVLHNHQPVGNFDGVMEAAYEDAYRPFLDVLESYPDLRISLHVSGPLMEWLARRRNDYLDRLAALAQAGRVEVVGGAFYEPILTMLSRRDRLGQLRDYRGWLQERLGAPVRGAWVAERVWEQSLTRDLVDAGVEYIVLDDFHFRNAGLREEELTGYFLTEDEGRVLRVFPGSERLRYLIPFGQPQETIDYLRGFAQRRPGAVLVFGDDGEKFGVWPETKKHVYDDGWLRRFFDALLENADWLRVGTLAEAVEATAPTGKIYLPDSSYREMTEWALPAERLQEYEDLAHEMEHDGRWPRIRSFLRGGFWRNFKVKYPEANEMYSRMMMVSQRLARAESERVRDERLAEARRELYRGQCNCAYWHGAFGGIYLPHLRHAVYRHLIAADNLLDQIEGRAAPWAEATVDDYNFDSRPEIRLANDRMVCLLAPAVGGQLYEWDVRRARHNLLATLSRRPEAYHRKVLAGAQQQQDGVASIHDRVVFKQEGLERRVQYDGYNRKSLIDHFFDPEVDLETACAGRAPELGDFVLGRYGAKVRRAAGRVQALLSRRGCVAGRDGVTVTKAVTVEAGRPRLEVTYLLEGLPADRPLRFGVELNFAGLPADAEGRYFHGGDQQPLGHLGQRLDLRDARRLGLTDEWLGLDVLLEANRDGGFWTFPIETVSQSEGGFELVHQSTVVMPHWVVQPDEEGRWSVTITARAACREDASPGAGGPPWPAIEGCGDRANAVATNGGAP